MDLLHINRLYYDPKALAYSRGQEVFDKYPNAEKVEVDSHWKIESLNDDPEQVRNWNQVKAATAWRGSRIPVPLICAPMKTFVGDYFVSSALQDLLEIVSRKRSLA